MMEHSTVLFFVLMSFFFGNISGVLIYHALMGIGL